jgi:putative transposase
MPKSRFTESQIVAILKEGSAEIPVPEFPRKHGIGRPTCFSWKSKYGGASVRELMRVKELEAENAELNRMYVESARENTAIKDLLSESCDVLPVGDAPLVRDLPRCTRRCVPRRIPAPLVAACTTTNASSTCSASARKSSRFPWVRVRDERFHV